MTNKIIMSNLFLTIFIIISVIDIVSSISCYRCSSINGSNPSCEDLFQGDVAGTPSFLHTPCLTQLRGRTGFFHATYCIKLVAYIPGPNPIQYTYRTCGREEADDNGISRASHCGFVKLDWIDPHRRFRGCLHICDKEGCNQSSYSIYSISRFIIPFSLLFLIFFRNII